MEGLQRKRFFSSILPLVLVLSLLSPFSQAAAAGQDKEESDNQQEMKAAVEEQIKLAARGAKLHKDLRGVSGDKEVAVIVHLSQKPVALEEGIRASKGQAFSAAQETDIKAKVEAQQSQVKTQLQAKNVAFNETYSYSTVLNGFSALVKADDLKKMLEVPEIRKIEPDLTVRMQSGTTQPQAAAPSAVGTNPTPSLLGVDKLWKEGIEGEGVKVAVLDTGIDPDHPEFKGVYKGGKNFVPFSAQYAKPRTDNDPSETKPSERPGTMPEFNEFGIPFATFHGTHVSGTIAAIGANPYGFKGMAPKVDLYVYRVLGAYGQGQISWVLAGIEEAAEQDMDVLNLSLGDISPSESDSMAYAANNATLAGTTSVLAAGNFGPYRMSIGSPATSRLGIAVGNTTIPEQHISGEVNAVVGDFKLSKRANLMASKFNEDPAAQLTGEYDLVAIPEAGARKDYEGIDVTGKVAVVALGRITPEEKIRVAKEKGAVAVFLHNIRNGEKAPEPSGYFIGDAFDFIPAFDLSQKDGEALRLHLKNGAGKTTFANFKTVVTKGDEVDNTSSRGPSTPNFDIKPDVVAPGMRILSTKPMYKADFPDADYTEAYSRESGTSMSAPHVTGIVALLKQAHPNWTPFDIKVALSNTAKRLDKKQFDVFSQGAGRVQAHAAAHPEVLAYAQDKAVQNETGTVVDNLKGTVTFGIQSLKEKNLSVSKKILVKDITGKGGAFKATVEVTKPFADAKVTVDQPAFTLNGEQELTVKLTASQMQDAGFDAEILGYIHLTKGKLKVSLPFAASFTEFRAYELENFGISESDLSPNGDGVKDKAELNLSLYNDLDKYEVTIFDLGGGEEGQPYFEEIGFMMEGGALKKGKHVLPVDGTYRPWNGDPPTVIPDGVYYLQFLGWFPGEGAYPSVYDSLMPFIVKTAKPAITGAAADNLATGKVTDKYLEFKKLLEQYGQSFDLNDKLRAAYVVTRNGAAAEPVPFKLEQDGTFSVPVPLGEDVEKIAVTVTDAAGNKGEAVIYQK